MSIGLLVFTLIIGIVQLLTGANVSAADDIATAAAGDIATVYIVSCNESSSGSSGILDGHAFLVVRNDSNSNITVGHYSLKPDFILSVGTWDDSVVPDGACAYYNIEKYRMINTRIDYLPSVYLKASVNQTELSKLTNAINNNYTWEVTKNCARFARYCWNSMFSSTSSYRIPAATVESPMSLVNKIKEKSSYSTNFKFGASRTCGIGSVYRHTAGGKVSLSAQAEKAVKG